MRAKHYDPLTDAAGQISLFRRQLSYYAYRCKNPEAETITISLTSHQEEEEGN